jgi:hypothetical protein
MSVIGSSDVIGRAPGGRKLIAVVYADMVGYSRLIGLDDLGSLSDSAFCPAGCVVCEFY